MLRNFLILFVCASAICFSASAQKDSTLTETAAAEPEEKPSPVITGSIDAYYRFNFSNPKTGGLNSYTSFTNSQNSFELGMASIKVDHTIGKASATIDLGFGRRAEEFAYTDGEAGTGKNGFLTLANVKQAYLSYAVSDKFKLTMGKWATHVGYELVDAYLNRNYSMSYMFSWGPFSHTGLKADIGLGGKSNLMFGIANTTDFVSTTSGRKFALAQFSTASGNDKVKAYLNYQGSYGGSYNLTQFDLVLTAALSDKFSAGFNGTVQSIEPDSTSGDSWWGSALYLNFDPVSNFGITLRGEYFHNEEGVVGAPATNIFDLTLSPNFKIGNLTIIPELRFDAGKAAIFEKNDGTLNKSTFTGLLAATYHF